jgi:hypothetical protein
LPLTAPSQAIRKRSACSCWKAVVRCVGLAIDDPAVAARPKRTGQRGDSFYLTTTFLPSMI